MQYCNKFGRSFDFCAIEINFQQRSLCGQTFRKKIGKHINFQALLYIQNYMPNKNRANVLTVFNFYKTKQLKYSFQII